VTFELSDLEALGTKAVDDLKACLSQQGAGEPYELSRTVDRLLGKLEFAYGVAARLAHREPTLEGTCAIWEKMVNLCDALGSQLQRLASREPAARMGYDRLLDFRNAAERRRDLHA